jgi:hypothetical protein
MARISKENSITRAVTTIGEKVKKSVQKSAGFAQKALDASTKEFAKLRDRANSLDDKKYTAAIKKQLAEKLKIHYSGLEPEIFEIANTLKDGASEGYNVWAKVRRLHSGFFEQEANLIARVRVDVSAGGYKRIEEVEEILLQIQNTTPKDDWVESQIKTIVKEKFRHGELIGLLKPEPSDRDRIYWGLVVDYKKNKIGGPRKTIQYVKFSSAFRIVQTKKDVYLVVEDKVCEMKIDEDHTGLTIPFPRKEEEKIYREFKKRKKDFRDKIYARVGEGGVTQRFPRLRLGKDIQITPKADVFLQDKITFTAEGQVIFKRFFAQPQIYRVSADFLYAVRRKRKGGGYVGVLSLIKPGNFSINW